MIVVLSTSVRELVERAAFDADLEPDHALRTDYSGRAMYGATCLALIGGLDDLVRFVVALTRAVEALYEDGDGPEESDQHDVGCELLDVMSRGTRQDSMGRELVFYWPSVRVVT